MANNNSDNVDIEEALHWFASVRHTHGKEKSYLGEGSSEKRVSAEQVQRWFSTAGKRLSVPNIEACAPIARSLNVMLDLGEPAPIQPTLGEAKRYGQLFLKHLPDARTKIEYLSVDHPFRQASIALLDQAEESVKGLLSNFEFSVPKWSWHSRAREVALLAQTAWRTVRKEPKSRGADGPLCGFVTAAMNEIGYPFSQEAISEALRGRRGVAARSRKGAKLVS
jgi:hypothetical protein